MTFSLEFKYGVVNSAKTANLLMDAHIHRQQNKHILVVKPSIDTRFGKDIVKSRAFDKDCDNITADVVMEPEDDETCLENHIQNKTVKILVDEAQFMSVKNIEALKNLSTIVPVVCYGLRTNYKSELFEGSKRLFELADRVSEFTAPCKFCNTSATVNAKILYNQIIKSATPEIDLGTEDLYRPMCWSCWNS